MVLLGGGQLSPDQLPREPRTARRLAKHRLRLPRVGAHHPRPDAELLVLRRPEQPAPAQPVCDRLQRQVGDTERGGREQQQRRDQQDVVLAVGDRALLPRVLDGGGASLPDGLPRPLKLGGGGAREPPRPLDARARLPLLDHLPQPPHRRRPPLRRRLPAINRPPSRTRRRQRRRVGAAALRDRHRAASREVRRSRRLQQRVRRRREASPAVQPRLGRKWVGSQERAQVDGARRLVPLVRERGGGGVRLARVRGL
mmetsp:Transcript_22607/g.74955  ORF Transcript_22607/g.74955 Transcript_22607/m.74955 type:complete len:255 (-) Transcript_22607:104-868(-)